MTGDFLGLCEVTKSCIKDGMDLVSACSVFKIRGAAEKDLVFLTEGGFLIKICMFVKK